MAYGWRKAYRRQVEPAQALEVARYEETRVRFVGGSSGLTQFREQLPRLGEVLLQRALRRPLVPGRVPEFALRVVVQLSQPERWLDEPVLVPPQPVRWLEPVLRQQQ